MKKMSASIDEAMSIKYLKAISCGQWQAVCVMVAAGYGFSSLCLTAMQQQQNGVRMMKGTQQAMSLPAFILPGIGFLISSITSKGPIKDDDRQYQQHRLHHFLASTSFLFFSLQDTQQNSLKNSKLLMLSKGTWRFLLRQREQIIQMGLRPRLTHLGQRSGVCMTSALKHSWWKQCPHCVFIEVFFSSQIPHLFLTYILNQVLRETEFQSPSSFLPSQLIQSSLQMSQRVTSVFFLLNQLNLTLQKMYKKIWIAIAPAEPMAIPTISPTSCTQTLDLLSVYPYTHQQQVSMMVLLLRQVSQQLQLVSQQLLASWTSRARASNNCGWAIIITI